jgi:hypothetical protein
MMHKMDERLCSKCSGVRGLGNWVSHVHVTILHHRMRTARVTLEQKLVDHASRARARNLQKRATHAVKEKSASE